MQNIPEFVPRAEVIRDGSPRDQEFELSESMLSPGDISYHPVRRGSCFNTLSCVGFFRSPGGSHRKQIAQMAGIQYVQLRDYSQVNKIESLVSV